MLMRTLGKTGEKVSEIGLGCWQLGGDFGPVGDDTATEILDTALSNGVNFWDTADVYGGGLSESRIGAHIEGKTGIFVATKVGRDGSIFPNSFTEDKVRRCVEGSLSRLKVDALDLVQIHCVPKPVLEDGALFGWMDQLHKDGLIKAWGASVETLAEAKICLEQEGLASLQIIFNIFRQDAVTDLLPLAHKNNVGVIVRLPLASGLLSGKFGADTVFHPSDHRNYNRDGASFSVGETFSGIAFDKGVELTQELSQIVPTGVSMSQFALRWILDYPEVTTVIAGVSKPEQMADNVAAASLPSLGEDVHARLREFYQNRVREHIRCEV